MQDSIRIELVEVERAVFLAGHAPCSKCRAPIRRSRICPLALVRKVFGENADAGWCPACGETTYFILKA